MKPSAATTTRGPCLLLIEEYSAVGDLIANYLGGAGYQVVVATDLTQAEALLATTRFALVLTDPFRLGTSELGTDRWSNLERVRDWAAGAPVIICSEYPAEHFPDYQQRGFAAFLRKPFNPVELLALVRRQLPLGGTGTPVAGRPRSAE